jgi:hypothetical protein
MVNVARYLSVGDYLLFDGEASFRTEAVQRLMSSYSLNPLVIEPSQLHQLISPCDNHFHSILKLSYYRLVSQESTSVISDEKKLLMAFQCYRRIGSDTILSMFRKCGLLTLRDKRTVVMELIAESVKSVRSSDTHRSNLLCYLRWCDENNFISLCSSLTPDISRAAGLLKY